MRNWIESQDRNEMTYWIGLLLLFVGLTFSVSVATAFVVIGAIMVAESVVTSYLASWMSK